MWKGCGVYKLVWRVGMGNLWGFFGFVVCFVCWFLFLVGGVEVVMRIVRVCGMFDLGERVNGSGKKCCGGMVFDMGDVSNFGCWDVVYLVGVVWVSGWIGSV